MKITRRQLRKIISEAITAGPEGVHRVPPEDRSHRVPVGRLSKDRFHGTAPKIHHIDPKIGDMFDFDDPEQQEQAYELSDTMHNYMPGTTQTAYDDMEYSKRMAKFPLSPMYDAIKDAVPPGFEFHEADHVDFTEEDENDPYGDTYRTQYDYVILRNAAGDREIEFTHDTHHFSGPHVIIRTYKVEPDDEFGSIRTMLDYEPAMFGMENPEEVKKKVDKLIARGRMK